MKKEMIGCVALCLVILVLAGRADEKTDQAIEALVLDQVILCDHGHINSMAWESVSSWEGEKYEWQKERLLQDREITMVVVYDDENTCTDELFKNIPSYLKLESELELDGKPVRFYRVDASISELGQESGGVTVTPGAWVWVKGERDNYWIGDKRLKAGLYPSLNFQLSENVRIFVQGEFVYVTNNDREDRYAGLNRAYLEINNLADRPLSLKVGRQTITSGRAFLMGEWEKAYDAVRLRYGDKEGLYVDVFAGTRDDSVFGYHPDLSLNKDDVVIAKGEDDYFSSVAGVIVGWRSNPWFLEGYTFLRDEAYPFLQTTSVGMRGGLSYDNGFSLQGEIVTQFSDEEVQDMEGYGPGDPERHDRNELGGYLAAKQKFNDAPLKPEFRLEYGYLSENFDTMDGDLLYSDIKWGRVRGPRRNLHVLHGGVTIRPLKKLQLGAFYSYFRRIEKEFGWQPNPYFAAHPEWGDAWWELQRSDELGEGSELDLEAVYFISDNKYLSINLGQFWPGKAYDTYTDNGQKKRYLLEIGLNMTF